MTQMNMKRVVIGGLVAGLIINISETIMNVPVLGPQMEAALKQLNLPAIGGAAIGVFVVGAFVLGLLLVWLYAAIRPRFGPGPKTAIIAGLVLWLLAYVWPSLGNGLMGFMPMKLLTVAVLWGLAEVIFAALVGRGALQGNVEPDLACQLKSSSRFSRVRPRSTLFSAPMMASARSRLVCCSSSTRSSTVFRVMSL